MNVENTFQTIHDKCMTKLEIDCIDVINYSEWGLLTDKIAQDFGKIVRSKSRGNRVNAIDSASVYLKYERNWEVTSKTYNLDGKEIKLKVLEVHHCEKQKQGIVKVKPIWILAVVLAILLISVNCFYVFSGVPPPSLSEIRKFIFDVHREAAMKKLFRVFWKELMKRFP